MHACCVLLATLLALIGPTGVICCSHGTRQCGRGCTSPLGFCLDGQCYDRKEKQVDCEPDYEQCNGVVCRLDEFCAGGRRCRPNNCRERQQYACPTDTSPLRSVTCVNATFTDCYESQHFNCSIGGSATLISCSLKPQQSSSAEPAFGRLRSQVVMLLLQAALAVALAVVLV